MPRMLIFYFSMAGQQKLPGNERIRTRADSWKNISFQLPVVAEKSSFSKNPQKRYLFVTQMSDFHSQLHSRTHMYTKIQLPPGAFFVLQDTVVIFSDYESTSSYRSNACRDSV